MKNVILIIKNNTDTKFYNTENIMFNNLIKFILNITNAKIDEYDETKLIKITFFIYKNFNNYIMLFILNHLLTALNYFIKIKGSSGHSDYL